MKCLASRQFFRGLWMDLSGEVADIHMRTDAKNLVTKARTHHLLEEKETILMICMLRHETCSGSIHDFAHISTRNCLEDCLTKSSAKADSLITAVKTVRFLEVDFHLNFRTLVEHKAFLSTWCRTFMHKKETFFSLNALKISLPPASREGPFHVMFWRTSIDSESQDATKITFCTRRLTHLFIHEDDDIVHVHCRSNQFSQWLSLSFSSQCCGNVDVKTRWSLQNHNRWTNNSAEQGKCWSQKDSKRLLITQVSIQIPWEWANGTRRRLSRVTFHTSHLSVAQMTLLLK